MRPEDVKKHFRTIANLTRALGLTRQAWYVWLKLGHVPIAQQIDIEQLTQGQLKADINDTRYKQPIKQNRKRRNGQTREARDTRSI